jgi:hypothetical protein
VSVMKEAVGWSFVVERLLKEKGMLRVWNVDTGQRRFPG